MLGRRHKFNAKNTKLFEIMDDLDEQHVLMQENISPRTSNRLDNLEKVAKAFQEHGKRLEEHIETMRRK
ncbi:hypothetical protein [Alkalicoccobacillus gibsonii]|uniref:hypothetical protein n=1 Tax=Alkalicoccobacillus gibsonii TaxID=79881 RepID=UPI00351746C4